MPFVTNISMADAINGRFPEWANDNTILIQIQDVDTERFANVKSRSRFVNTYQFRFDDIEDIPSVDFTNGITDDQAEELGEILKASLKQGLNVVAHCHAGLCRSGAVTEIAVMLGFDDVDNNARIPNITVKQKLRKSTGLAYSWE